MNGLTFALESEVSFILGINWRRKSSLVPKKVYKREFVLSPGDDYRIEMLGRERLIEERSSPNLWKLSMRVEQLPLLP